MPRFSHNTKFDDLFDTIPGLTWYPYVGAEFEQGERRVLVLAHNIPVGQEKYRERGAEMQQKPFWTRTLDEYAYTPGWWTNAFRSFVKGSTGLTANFDGHSAPEVTQKVDSFVRQIAYVNFIQGLVLSEKQLACGTADQIARSKPINAALIEVLGITHCICWGGHVFSYLADLHGYSTVETRSLSRKGFAYGLLRAPSGKYVHLLKVHHPSMPGFGSLSPETHQIIATFLATPVLKKTVG